MSAANLSAVTTEVIAAYGNTAKNVITAYRAGGERVSGFVGGRWESALSATSARLSADVQANARHAQKVVGGYYTKGMDLSTAGATAVVDQCVKLAEQGVGQVAANASLFEEKTGITALTRLAVVAVPAAQAVSKLATQIEQKSGALAQKIAGDKGIVAAVKHAGTKVRKTRARKVASAV